MNMNMAIETHAPSQPVLVVGVVVALLAIILYFLSGANSAFWLMTLAYVVASLGTVVKTSQAFSDAPAAITFVFAGVCPAVVDRRAKLFRQSETLAFGNSVDFVGHVASADITNAYARTTDAG